MIEKQKLIYLACPYTHKDPTIREHRFEIANAVAAKLMASGLFVFSPISHTHPIACAGELPKNWEFWKGYDEIMLSKCDVFLVINIPGWKESVGVQAEIALANEYGIPVIMWPEECFNGLE